MKNSVKVTCVPCKVEMVIVSDCETPNGGGRVELWCEVCKSNVELAFELEEVELVV